MKMKPTILILALMLAYGCYNPEEDLTSIRDAEFNLILPTNDIVADGLSEYEFEIKLPGLKNGNPKTVSLTSTWGSWVNDSASIDVAIEYNAVADAYTEMVKLKAARSFGPFTIQLNENSSPLKTISLEAQPQYPSRVQIVSDSIEMQLSPGNTAQLKAFFFSENGFPSNGIRYKFETDADVNIFPDEVLIQSSETMATLQITTETVLDTISIYGSIPELGLTQPAIDTLRIALINN